MSFSSANAPASASHKAIIAQLLSDDAELRDLARQFIVLGMQEVINQLTRGDQATRATIARSLASTLTKAITEVGEEDGNATLRAEMQEMMAEMRGEWMDEPDVEPQVAPVAVARSRIVAKT